MLYTEMLASVVVLALGFLALLWISRFVYQLVKGPPRENEDLDGPEDEPTFKVCPQCAEEVKGAALICRYCRYEFP